jgi:hypothetical protein
MSDPSLSMGLHSDILLDFQGYKTSKEFEVRDQNAETAV